jgi:hypothetical protein
MATQKRDSKVSVGSDAANLTDEQEAYAQLVFAKIKGTMEQDLLAMCRMMAARPDHELLGAGEFALRDMLNQAGAKVLEQAANVRAKKGVLG